MGLYLNPGNEGFRTILKSEYVDKTGLIALVNHTLDTPGKLTCISRPRRFGKSYAAKMLCAYYDKTCDSAALFRGLAVSEDDSFRSHLNKYDVIYLDMTSVMEAAGDVNGVIEYIKKAIAREFSEAHYISGTEENFFEILLGAVEITGNKLIFIIDEWDAVFREAKENEKLQKAYIDFLRALFKGSGFTDRVFAGAYMTGILPIKKYGTQSAISDFIEYTMLQPGEFTQYVGFEEEEVRILCNRHDMSFEQMKHWYDGYSFRGVSSVYNPNSVINALRFHEFGSYWSQSETFHSLAMYIDMDFEGLQQDIIQMLGGARIAVNVRTFQNDMVSVRSKDEVMTLLVHLGYLAYDREDKTVRIPNEEIRLEFKDAVETGSNTESSKILLNSERLLRDTIAGREGEVAKALKEAHDSGIAPLYYNDEQALRAIIKVAYISAVDHYIKIEELPSGHGYADVVFIPRRTAGFTYPAMVIELKWNKTAESAMNQILDRDYPSALCSYGGEILAVGISYDEATKEHSCRIRRV